MSGRLSAPPPEAARPPPAPAPPGGRRVVYDHIHHGSLKLGAFQSFDGGRRSLFVKLDKSKALRPAPAITGNADGADLPIDREDLLQITIGDLRG